MNTCLCGCGEPVASGRSYRRGHVARTTAFKAAVYAPRTADLSPPNPSGQCLCGCGQPTTIAAVTDRKRGNIKGHPTRYLRGHSPTRFRTGEDHHLWKGGRTLRDGYVLLHLPDHPGADQQGWIPEHRVVWEQAHGRHLKPHQHIHHINGVRDDNRPANLLAVTNAEHKFIHGSVDGRRSAAIKKGLLPSTTARHCEVCGADYKATHRNQRFCTTACSGRARSKH